MQDVSCAHSYWLHAQISYYMTLYLFYLYIYHMAWVKIGCKLSSYYCMFIVSRDSSLCVILLFVVFTTKDGWTALMVAAEGGHNETVQLLIAAGADVSLKVRI